MNISKKELELNKNMDDMRLKISQLNRELDIIYD